MDAIDILGSLLGHKSSRTGRGTDILNDILKGDRAVEARPRSIPSGSAKPQPGDIEREAKELEDLLNIANERKAGRRSEQPRPPQPPQPPRSRSLSNPVPDLVTRVPTGINRRRHAQG